MIFMFTYTNQSPPLACRSVCSTLSMRRSHQEAIVEAIQHEIMPVNKLPPYRDAVATHCLL